MDRGLVQAKQSRSGADKVARIAAAATNTTAPKGVGFVRFHGDRKPSDAGCQVRYMSGRRDDAGPSAVLIDTGLRAKDFFRRGHRAEPNAGAWKIHRASAINDTKGVSTGE